MPGFFNWIDIPEKRQRMLYKLLVKPREVANQGPFCGKMCDTLSKGKVNQIFFKTKYFMISGC